MSRNAAGSVPLRPMLSPVVLWQERCIGHRSEMAKLVGVDHGADRLDNALGGAQLDHTDHARFGVVELGARLAVDPGQPEGGAAAASPSVTARSAGAHTRSRWCCARWDIMTPARAWAGLEPAANCSGGSRSVS